MITRHNLKEALTILGFHETANGNFAKSYGTLDSTIEIDFSGIGKITWPNGLVARDDTTSNFSSNENFVVLECVDGLLKKGYRPEHIVLEEKWMLGHEQKGGKADVCVYDLDNSLLLIIECKTAGEEFRKFKKQLFTDGGQLFSYWQQDRSAKWLCLYASDLTDGNVDHSNSIVVINCSDDPNMEKTAESDESVHLYRHANSVEQLFQVWDETYNKQTCPDVIFGEDSQAYRIGIRRLRKKDLRQFSKDDAIVNRFEEILRHNNVSDKENAFNKLVSMFICKLVDEMSKGEDDELDFQYRVGSDTYETLQDRLQRLHRDGMQQFMDEKIFYVDSDYAEKLFAQYTRSDRQRAIHDLRETIRKLKFFSNNDFAFKEVHNEELFLQNSKILVEMVQLFEPFQIVYPARDQLLGDLFEQLLSKGFKQDVGQFFTAMPITHFIWESLPLERIIKRGGKMYHPRVIDYACGAGHFLTEGVEAVNAFYAAEGGKKSKDNSWVEKFIYGVEKDYRLARVSKVSLHMNGAGKGSIIFGDGLENYPEKGIEAGKFDILVANPPYSVEAFKSHLRLKNNELLLLGMVTDQGSEIEALFVERTAQLLKPGGVAAVVLPCSILTGPGPYVGARDEILNHFKIRAIVGLNKNAFQATSTETIILFLEKYDEPPRRCEMIIDSVDAILSGGKLDDWEDKEIFKAYLCQIGVSEEDYLKFIKKCETWAAWRNHEYFGQYVKAFENAAEIKALRTKSSFKKLSLEDQDAELSERFYRMYLDSCGVEREKLQTFGMVYNQKTLIVRSPDDKNAERKFLGYSWSNRRGQEGIQIEKAGGMLYDDSQRRAPGTIASGIRDSYDDEIPYVTQGEDYTKFVPRKDLLDFSRVKFDKAISMAARRYGKLPKGMSYLDAVAEYGKDRVPFSSVIAAEYITTDNMLQNRGGIIPYAGNAVAGSVVQYRKGDTLISNIRPYLKKIWLADRDGGCSPDVLVIRVKDKSAILPEYLNICLSMDEFFSYTMDGKTGVKMPRGDKDSILRYGVRIPGIGIQKKIVAECAKLDTECEKYRKEIQKCEKKIESAYVNLLAANKKTISLADKTICSLSIGKRVVDSQLKKDGSVPVMSANVFEPMGMIDVELLDDYSVESVLWGIDGDWMVCVWPKNAPFYPTDHCGVLRLKTNKVLPAVMARLLEDAGKRLGFKRSLRASIDRVASINVDVPPVLEQEKFVKVLEEENLVITQAHKSIESVTAKKAAILEEYLKQD